MNGIGAGAMAKSQYVGIGTMAGTQQANTPAALLPMQSHAQIVHALASDLQGLNDRLGKAIDRVCGPVGEITGDDPNKQPDPQGALMVAQFGAVRIDLGVRRLNQLIERLEGIV